jgi:hypothetical protein
MQSIAHSMTVLAVLVPVLLVVDTIILIQVIVLVLICSRIFPFAILQHQQFNRKQINQFFLSIINRIVKHRPYIASILYECNKNF